MKKNKLIRCFFAFITGLFFGYKLIVKIANKKVEKLLADRKKFKNYYYFISYWLLNKIKGACIEDYFRSMGVSKITIYGMGELGCILYEELKDTSINIVQAIDKNLGKKYQELSMCQIDNMNLDTDMIVVTPIFAFEKIEKELRRHYFGKIVSLENVIYEGFE